jgi:ribosomal protein S18 acetylase RimI-like enzyme
MLEYGCLKIIPWETRNLCRQSFAIDQEQLPLLTENLLVESLAMIEKQYGEVFVQVRVDKKNYAALPVIQRQGFYFVETTLVPCAVLKKNATLKRFVIDKREFIPSRFRVEDLDLILLNKLAREQRNTVKEIAAESFSDDRFHLDPQCPNALADRRFSFWVDDLLVDAAVAFDLLILAGDCVGFMARKEENLILAGFSRRHVGSGLGDFLWLSVLQRLQTLGLNQCYTLISANNTAVLNLYARLGFKFKDPAVTLHYWSGGCASLGVGPANYIDRWEVAR